MRKHWAIAAGLAAAVIAAALLLWLPRHERIPRNQCSVEYLLFLDSRHVAAAFTRDFPINDSLAVDITTLVALDSAGWDTLMSFFHMEDMRARYATELSGGKDIILSKRYSPDTAAAPERHFFVAASPLRQTVCIYHTATRSQERALLEYQFNKTYYSINKKEDP